jgi:2-octaprenyl-6-methoxyphenol hydroxylase
VVTRAADRLVAERTAIIAEAAHVLPPIGAQGLNTSLHDVATLEELARQSPDSLGTPDFLQAFQRARARDIQVRARAIDLYNRVCKSDAPALQDLRTLGLKLAHDIAPIRRGLMKAGLGRQAT